MKFLKQFLLFAFISAAIFSCRPDERINETKLVADFDYKPVFEWNNTFFKVERYADGYRPGPAPRGLAYLGLSAYEACISGMPGYNSMSGKWNGFNVPAADPNLEYCWPVVINASYEYLMPRFFAEVGSGLQSDITSTANKLYNQYQGTVSSEVYERSIARGKQVAEIVWNWSTTDEYGHDHYKDNTAGWDWQAEYKKPGDYVMTPPNVNDKTVGGLWGKARAFSLSESDKICKPFTDYMTYSESPTSEYYAQALETYSQNTPSLSYEDEWIAQFWSDDIVGFTLSPGPRILSIGTQILEVENATLETAILMNVQVSMAICDASIGAWASKFYYNIERPITYINRVIDPNWKTSLVDHIAGAENVTPPFPTYPSGHSTMVGAGSEALTAIFGFNYAFTDRCHEDRTEFNGKARSFSSFIEMAQEDAWSRVPLGVHFRADSEEGVRYGREIGRKVLALGWKK